MRISLLPWRLIAAAAATLILVNASMISAAWNVDTNAPWSA
jgi:hypothetical protein